MPDALATIDDLAARLTGTTAHDDPVRAQALLDGASASVRAYCGQQFTAATTTIKIKVRNGVVRLPQRPVTAVSAVTDLDANELEYTWVAGDRIDVCNTITPFDRDINLIRNGWVQVTYSYGHAEIPPVIVDIVCQIAGRLLGTSAETSGVVTQEALGPYSYQTSSSAQSGTVGLTAAERRVLDTFRRVGSTAWIAG